MISSYDLIIQVLFQLEKSHLERSALSGLQSDPQSVVHCYTLCKAVQPE
jgi:hypothetical protein